MILRKLKLFKAISQIENELKQKPIKKWVQKHYFKPSILRCPRHSIHNRKTRCRRGLRTHCPCLSWHLSWQFRTNSSSQYLVPREWRCNKQININNNVRDNHILSRRVWTLQLRTWSLAEGCTSNISRSLFRNLACSLRDDTLLIHSTWSRWTYRRSTEI